MLSAPAKLNLFLKTLGKREDGYHEIETVMQMLDLHDTLRFRETRSGEISLALEQVLPCQNRSSRLDPIPADHRNLVVQAAQLLRERTGCSAGAEILLRKRIPSQAGLGGGSSNAATTLLALNRLWQLNLSRDELCGFAAELGSDIPFFVAEDPLAIGRGRGENLEAVSGGRSLSYVLVKPNSGLSTASVYASCTVSPFLHSSKELINALHSPDLGSVKYYLHNSLQEPAQELNVDVGTVLSTMRQYDFLATMMSGSGTTCFGICRNHRSARILAGKLRHRNVGTVHVVRGRV